MFGYGWYGPGFGWGRGWGRGLGFGARMGFCPWTGLPRGWRWAYGGFYPYWGVNSPYYYPNPYVNPYGYWGYPQSFYNQNQGVGDK